MAWLTDYPRENVNWSPKLTLTNAQDVECA